MRWKITVIAAALLVVSNFAARGIPAADYEATPVLKAADLLDGDLLKGPHHEIESQVVNDGFMNRFTIRSDFGTFEVTSERMVPVRVREIGAIAELDEMSRSEVFTEALAAAAKKPMSAAKQIASDPVGTVKAIPEGVGRMFKKASRSAKKAAAKVGDAVGRDGEGGKEEGVSGEVGSQAWATSKDFLGYSSAKRRLAKRVAVDPYSTNVILQKKLDDLAWAAFVGEVGIGQAMGKVPLQGEIGAVSDMVWSMSPADLEVANREKMKAMGATEEVANLFYGSRWYTPSMKTAVVALLEEMKAVEGRPKVFEKEAAVENGDQAQVFLGSLRILREFHRSAGPVKRIAGDRILPWGVTEKDELVVPAAIDHLAWTEKAAGPVGKADDYRRRDPSWKRAELRLGGTLSDRARREIETLGWSVVTNALPVADRNNE